MTQFKIGDTVHNTHLSSKHRPISGGFPWSLESKATIVAFHPSGTSWNQSTTVPDTYMIQYESSTQWGSTWTSTDRTYPAYAYHLRLANVEPTCDAEGHIEGRVIGWNILCLRCEHIGYYDRNTKAVDWTKTAYEKFRLEK